MKLAIRNSYPKNLFGSFVDDFFAPSIGGLKSYADYFEPAVDVHETEKSVTVTAELPGLDKNDIQVSVENNILTLKGEKKREESKTEGSHTWTERVYGSFERKLKLPAEVNSEDIKASYVQGVLNITIGKQEKSSAKKIEIQ